MLLWPTIAVVDDEQPNHAEHRQNEAARFRDKAGGVKDECAARQLFNCRGGADRTENRTEFCQMNRQIGRNLFR